MHGLISQVFFSGGGGGNKLFIHGQQKQRHAKTQLGFVEFNIWDLRFPLHYLLFGVFLKVAQCSETLVMTSDGVRGDI